MKNKKEHIRILEALSLAASDTREDTLISIVLNALFQYDEIAKSDFCTAIEEIYGFEPYQDEFFQIIDSLVLNKRLNNSNGIYSLTEDEKIRFQESDLINKDREKVRFQNFKNFITDNLEQSIDTLKIKFLWSTFVEYVYNNFYEYGVDALEKFHPFKNSEEINLTDENCIQLAYAKLNDKYLCDIFKQTIERFPDYASADDIDFLNDLAQKTLCFASLGVSPDTAEYNVDKKIVDWVLYLDTNVLYSILDLHKHPENDACKALVSLIRGNRDYIKILLRYSELTKRELNSKRDDFELLDEKLPNSSVSALLRSDRLDDFAKQFYENLLHDRNSTLHPYKVIDLAPNTLIKKEIDISRNQKRVEKIGEEYLNTRIQDYRRYIDERNDIKREFCEQNKIPFYEVYRSDKQIIHDITLREIILDQRESSLRKNEAVSLKSVKYFGVTLDDMLHKYDKSQLKDYNDGRRFPVFFKPSFLLNKLVKVLPIKTTDYKKAFLKAVTSKGFNKDVQKSHDILRIVNYLKKQGIDDEQVVLNLISEDIFLEKYKKNKNKEDFNQGEFIESELNRAFKQREEELTKTKVALESKENEIIKTSRFSVDLLEKKASLETELQLYKSALKKIQSDVDKLKDQNRKTDPQQQINFDAAESRIKADAYKNELIEFVKEEIHKFKKQSLRKWQNRVWWNLFWVVPLTLLGAYFIIFYNSANKNNINLDSIRFIVAFFTLLIDGIFIYLIKNRYWDEGNKQKRLENMEVPEDLSRRLKELT